MIRIYSALFVRPWLLSGYAPRTLNGDTAPHTPGIFRSGFFYWRCELSYDWEAIERDYYAGQLSIREIARQYGCSDTAIRKKAKEKGWSRNLTKKVRNKVRDNLVRTVRNANPGIEPGSDEETIAAAAAVGVEAIRSHHKQISFGVKVVKKLMGNLEEAVDSKEEIESDIIEDTKDDGKRRARMLRAVSIGSQSSSINSLSLALKTFIGLERQALNLDDDGGKADESEIVQELRTMMQSINDDHKWNHE